MAKRTQKIGMFDERQKTSPQQALQRKFVDEDIQGAQALRPTQRKGVTQTPQPVFNEIGNQSEDFDYMIRTSQQIPIRSMIDSSSKTGVLSQRDVRGAIGNFLDKLGQATSVSQVKVKDDEKAGIKGLEISKEYQKADYKFNPAMLAFTTKGWDTEIPEHYIKVSDTQYRAPTEQFRRSHDRRVDYTKSRRDRVTRDSSQMSSFSPSEIFLTDTGKLSKVIKRDVYTPYLREVDSRDRSYTTRERKSVYDTKIQEFFGSTGLLKQERDWDTYITRATDSFSYGNDDWSSYRRISRDIYLKQDAKYAPTGRIQSVDQYAPMLSYRNYKFQRGVGSTEHIRETPYLQKATRFDEMGQLEGQKRWSPIKTGSRQFRGMTVEQPETFMSPQERREIERRRELMDDKREEIMFEEPREVYTRMSQDRFTDVEAGETIFVSGQKVAEFDYIKGKIDYFDVLTGDKLDTIFW